MLAGGIRVRRNGHRPGRRDDGGTAVFRGQFAAVTELEPLDMSVLGRDISNLFALIVDRPRDLVCLLGAGHQYSITHAGHDTLPRRKAMHQPHLAIQVVSMPRDTDPPGTIFGGVL